MAEAMTVGFTAGAFDLLHAGHVHFLSQCKQHCDFLIVGLHTDPSTDRKKKNKPIQSVYERYIQLSGLSYVDKIIPYDTEHDLINMIACEKMDLRFMGSDYIGALYTGHDLCKKIGISVVFIQRLHDFSSTELRNRMDSAKKLLME